jgi:hypothetical protein
VRIAHRIGINRRLKNVTPSLSDYLEAHATSFGQFLFSPLAVFLMDLCTPL